MRETTRRPQRLKAARSILADQNVSDEPLFSPGSASGAGLLRPLRVLRRGGSVVLWTLPWMPIQAVFIALPGSL